MTENMWMYLLLLVNDVTADCQLLKDQVISNTGSINLTDGIIITKINNKMNILIMM